MAKRPLPAAEAVPIKLQWDGPTLTRFMESGKSLVYIQGPYGSGKTYCALMKLFLNALCQPINPKTKRRRRRTYIVRETYDQLERGPLKTWAEIFPPAIFGSPSGGRPAVHHITWGDLDWEVIFLALDGTDDKAKLESAEPSDAYVNEGRHLPWDTIKTLKDRLGRYPKHTEEGCFLPQLIIDSNAPPEDHPLAVMSGQCPIPDGVPEDQRGRYVVPVDPATGEPAWDFFVQPPAVLERRDADGNVVGYDLNPERENQAYLRPTYYTDMLQGATKAEIRERLLNRPGTYRNGKPVWPQFREETHVARQDFEAADGHPVLIGVDFGRTPAAIFGQQVFGQWRILRELIAEGMGARAFAREVKRSLAQWFPGCTYSIWGDPAGENFEQSDDISPFLMFRAEGLRILPAPTNDPAVRIGAVDELMRRMVDGKPGLLIAPRCRILRAACAGGYQYKRIAVAGAERYAESPAKDRYSHPADAFQYLVVGGGEGAALLGRAGGAVAGMARAAARVVHRARGWGAIRGRD